MTVRGARSSTLVAALVAVLVSSGLFHSGGGSAALCAPLKAVQLIEEGWSVRKVGDEDWIPATVPGCVHTDLLRAGLIEPPFYGCNEKDLQWIEDCDWEYRKTVLVTGMKDDDRVCELVFEGIDTYSDVYLNDSLIVSTDNMFREWRADCTALLRDGANVLRVLIRSAPRHEREEASTLPYELPGGSRVFTRKAAYHYGWDWGPRFVTAGIWRPVSIEVW
ncbi:MAG TPA: hypothetical protein VLA34_02750, partial [Candidatus Krumholzibacterium sp.]|nr:hypothetical protein [Candidatus Krumholzibacterium sp.]